MKVIFKVLLLSLVFSICFTIPCGNVYAGKDTETLCPGFIIREKYLCDPFYVEYVSQISGSSLIKIYKLINFINPNFRVKRSVYRDVEALRYFFCDNQSICKDFVIQYVEEYPDCKKVFQKNVRKQNFQDEYTKDESYKDDPFFKECLCNLKLKDLRHIVCDDKELHNLSGSRFGLNLDFALSCPRVLRKFLVESKHIAIPVVELYIKNHPDILGQNDKNEPEEVLQPTTNEVSTPTVQVEPFDQSDISTPINSRCFIFSKTPAVLDNPKPPVSFESNPIEFMESFRLVKK